MERKKVSIVIPCYNAEKYIGSAIESALSQTYSPVEVVVVDDGSTDDSLETIHTYAEKIEIISTENHGACHARNKGVRRATGTFIKFLDADDVLRPHIVGKQVEESNYINDERGIVYSDVGRMEEDGTGRSPRSLTYRPREKKEDEVEFILTNDLNTQCPLHRKSFLKEVGGFDEGFLREQDYDLHLKLCMAGISFYYWSGIGGFLRQHDDPERIGNKSHLFVNPQAVFNQYLTRYKRLRQYFGGNPPDVYRRHIAQRAWNGGRALLSEGRTDEAERYFALAEDVHPIVPPRSPLLYKMIVRVVGSVRAERLLLHLRS